MRKLFFVMLLSICATVTAWSQPMSSNAIGLKFGAGVGDFIGLGADVSYQRALSEINRLELNLGFSSKSSVTRFSLEGFYQWVKPLQGGLNWYVGPGAGVGFASVKNGSNKFFLGIAGQVGLEYRFKFPLQLTLDVNPYFGLLNSEGFGMPIQLGVRYMF